MHYICPVCHTQNTLELTFPVEEYACKSCSNLIDIDRNASKKVIKKPVESVVLEIGQKGIIEGHEYTVVAMVVRKYGSSVYWREYYLKNNKGEDAFLSESDGHWVFLVAIPGEKMGKSWGTQLADYNERSYRWYETTQCHIHAAAGFFEEKLNFRIATYKEYVNGIRMISEEESGSKIQYFSGKHISKYDIKKGFKLTHMPNYSGIGIVQPYYVDIKQAINIVCLVALLICLLQLYVFTSRTNYTVIEQTIKFEEVKNKEFISNSFMLSGGSAPLKVDVYSDVDNSWVNLQLSLVNEKTNEVTYTSKDIEEYHGYEDGESWSEGSKDEKFNICGVAPGKYHFVITGEKQPSMVTSNSAFSLGHVTISKEASGIINVTNINTNESVAFGDLQTLERDSTEIGKLVKETFPNKNLDSLLRADSIARSSPEIPDSSSFRVKAIWLPVSFWNFGIVLLIMIIFFIACYWGRYLFNVSKWSNSSNSPYNRS